MNKLRTLILFFICFATANSHAQQSPVTTLDDIRIQCRKLLLSDTAYATEQSFRLTDDVKYNTDAAGYFKALTPDGTWKDLNYSLDSPSSWPPCWHLYRLMLLCREYYKNNNPQYLAAIHKALGFYIKNDFKCSNWWQNEINVPYCYSSLMLMLDKDATPAEIAYLNNVQVGRALQQKNPTGQNKIWQKDIEARMALLHNDQPAFIASINSMQSVITQSTAEGIQPDNSFQQHGAMLQFGNYGLHFVNSLLFWIKLTAHTPYAFDKDKQQIIFNYCSEGLRWTVFKGAMDITAVGRQLRPNFTGKRGANLNDDFSLIKSFDNNPCNYYLDGLNPAMQCTLAGNKDFWRSDYMVQLQSGQYMMSVKTHGPFVKRVESINGENLQGAYLNNGVSLIQRNGNEYKNIQAIWRWNMLPGTTTDTTLAVTDPQVLASKNESAFVGQISDGTIGASAMYYNRLGVSAYKSYFFINDMMVALGAGITSAKKENVVTTVNQRYYNFKTGKQLKGENWVWHDGIGYFFPDRNAELKTVVQKRKADWGSVDKASAGILSTDSVITWYLGHNNTDKYQYMIKPNFGVVDTRKLAYHLPVKVIANTKDIQAVQSAGTVIAVFYRAGILYMTESQRIQTDQSCMLIFKTGAKGTEIWVSDPTRKLQTVNLLINKRPVQVQLPQGELLGSVIKVL
ncbi:MAG: polysaccharide lyase family 8 super-sandwich domain-containing protein [Bacteroidota bacterium]